MATSSTATTHGASPTLGELGVDRLRPPVDGNLPLNGGLWSMPHYATFVALMNQMVRTYWWSFDEALRDSQCNTHAMRNDLVVRSALTSRSRPVCSLEWQIEPINAASKEEVAAGEEVTKIVKDIPYFQQLRRTLLEAIWFGKYGVQLLTRYKYVNGAKRLVIPRWYPVHGDKIIFKWDGTPGILVNASFPGVREFTERGTAHFMTPEEEATFIWHEFEPEDADFYQPEAAGMVHGSGYRGRVYWWWWLRQNAQRFMMNFLNKAGNGYILAGYQSGNTRALNAMKTAIEGQQGNNTLYVPMDLRNQEDLDKVLRHVPVQMTGAQMQWTVITGINELIRSAIMGESLTTQGGATGLGSNLADHHGMTGDDRIKYDSQDLETPLQKIVNLIYEYTFPTITPGKFQHLADKRNPEEVMNAASFATKIGLGIPQSWVQQELGIPSQIGNEPMLALIQSQQGVAIGNQPAGVPQVGDSGPGSPPPGSPPPGAPQQ